MSGWDGFVHEHGPFIYTTAWRVLGHAGEAEDVVQEVFREALAAQRRGEPFRVGLLRRLTVQRALDRLRARRGRWWPPGGELEGRLRLAIGGLPEREAAVFSLRYFGGLPDQQIAEACQITPRAVAEDLEQAQARLESLLTSAASA